MKETYQASSTTNSPKCSGFAFKSAVIAGLLLLSVTFSACKTTLPQANQLPQSEKSNLPRGMKNAEEDIRLMNEEFPVITVKDDSGAYFMGKDQVSKEQVGER